MIRFIIRNVESALTYGSFGLPTRILFGRADSTHRKGVLTDYSGGARLFASFSPLRERMLRALRAVMPATAQAYCTAASLCTRY